MTCLLLITSTTAEANNIQLCGKKAQGEILKGYAPDAAQVILNKKNYMLTPSGSFILSFGRDDKTEQILTIINKNGSSKTFNLTIAPTAWDIQNIKGLPQKTVTPSNMDQKQINRERTDVRASLYDKLNKNYWEKGFILPVKGRISGHFGGQRIMNGSKMNPHQGTDIAAPEGTPIKASSDGIVRLSGGNYFYSGNMVVIDHGQQLFTIYAHMKTTDVKVGDYVKQGQTIGQVGKTGRATGPHLHWGASLNNVRFTPTSLLYMNNTDFCFNL